MEWRVFRYWLYWKGQELRIWFTCRWLNLTKHRVRVVDSWPGVWAEVHAVHKDVQRWDRLRPMAEERDRAFLRYIDEKYRR